MITHDVRVTVLQNVRMMRRACRSTAAALFPVMMLSILELSGASTSAEEQSRKPFLIAGREVAAGQRVDLDIPVPEGRADPATVVPITVFHGAAAGPVLALTAGVHGYEYPRFWLPSSCSRASIPSGCLAQSSWSGSRTSRPSSSACPT